ncbi:MAG: BamA/TamA family outer membrane protein [Gemmatimonadales bacterium]
MHCPHRVTGRLAALAILALAAPVAAQAPAAADSVTLVPGAGYQLHGIMSRPSKLLFGTNNRELWLAPLTLPVADPASEGGGLVPTGIATGSDSGVLLLSDGAGAAWQFRPLTRPEPRDIPALVPAGVHQELLLDLVSGKNPAGPMVAVPLAKAAGVPILEGRLVALASTPGLGPFEQAYGGQAGYLLGNLARPDTAPPDAIAPGTVLDTRALMPRLVRVTPDRIDAPAVLRQWLFSIFIGDLNPRWLQWNWRAVGDSGGITWEPVGRFPEMALADWNGAGARAIRPDLPDLVNFGPKYPSHLAGTPAQLTVARWLIGNLPWMTWDSVAHELQAGLTDSAITSAVSCLPPSYTREFSRQLLTTLQTRRDHLPEASHRLYDQLRAIAEMLGSEGSDLVAVVRTAPDTMVIRIDSTVPRSITGKETREVRLYLRGGADTVRVSGAGGNRPTLRIITFEDLGGDLLQVAPGAGGGLRLSDSARTFRVEPPGAAKTDRAPYDDPLGAEIWKDRLPRESGVTYRPTAWFEGNSAIGVLLGAGVVRTDWNGAARPYRSRMRLRAGYGTGAEKGAVEFTSVFYFASTPLRTTLDVAATGLALVRFYGYGNETAAPGPSSYYRSIQNQYLVLPGVALPFGDHALLSAGLAFKRVETPFQPGYYISVAQPYGTPLFGQAGLTGGLSWDSRDVKGAPHRGAVLTIDGAWYPLINDGSGAFGNIGGALSTYWTPRRESWLTVAMRATGKLTLGHYPVHEAAFLGGATTVRGLPDARYAGDASVYGNLDLRIRLVREVAVTRWDFGVLLLADAGRVFLAGQTSRVWHPSFGGGLWVAMLNRSLVGNINVASGAGQGTFVRFGGGFIF